MSATMELHVVTPTGTTVVEDVVFVRFDAEDGSRGIQPRHEPATVVVLRGAVEIRQADDTAPRFIAIEDAMAEIDRHTVRLVTAWAQLGDDLDELAGAVAERSRFRAEVEAQARALAHQHEVATKRALMALRRDVHD